MAATRRVVVDVLKPHDPPLVEFTSEVAEADTVDGVTSSLVELDQEVQNVILAFEGADLDFGAIEERVQTLGATVHSVDAVGCGEQVPESHGDHPE